MWQRRTKTEICDKMRQKKRRVQNWNTPLFLTILIFGEENYNKREEKMLFSSRFAPRLLPRRGSRELLIMDRGPEDTHSRRGRLMDRMTMMTGIMAKTRFRTSRRIQGKRKIFL